MTESTSPTTTAYAWGKPVPQGAAAMSPTSPVDMRSATSIAEMISLPELGPRSVPGPVPVRAEAVPAVTEDGKSHSKLVAGNVQGDIW